MHLVLVAQHAEFGSQLDELGCVYKLSAFLYSVVLSDPPGRAHHRRGHLRHLAGRPHPGPGPYPRIGVNYTQILMDTPRNPSSLHLQEKLSQEEDHSTPAKRPFKQRPSQRVQVPEDQHRWSGLTKGRRSCSLSSARPQRPFSGPNRKMVSTPRLIRAGTSLRFARVAR